ncbi:hypothetical protein RN001_014293 [Aquatica leii]|uniref:Citramalyl-CoA lyase, mitochondrial n=1 Tax=Aquatica leii TaxID=1421715 RepID=A0AAN7SLZ4_9COLE|nr:hypothetical protein RN001_014293 [Aquatica leii]
MFFLKSLNHVNKLSNSIKNVISVRYYRPRRALMYVPGDSSRKLTKAFNLDVDCIAMDCEDGVAMNKKDEARETIRNILNHEKVIVKRDFDRAVRVNCIGSGLCEEDLKALLTAKFLPDTVLLPKVESVEHIQWFAEKVNALIKGNGNVDFVIFIENPIGLINSHQICRAAVDLAQTGKFTPSSIVFGSDDFCAALGATRSEDGVELLYARQKTVLIAKAFNLQAIDRVHIEFKDLIGLRKYCEQGARMGYTGKQVIHPDQVPIVQEAFLPSKTQFEWATGLLTAFNEYQKKGAGAFVYKGAMIDKPTMKQAQNIVDVYESTKNA